MVGGREDHKHAGHAEHEHQQARRAMMAARG
jgi:hypothetical protein